MFTTPARTGVRPRVITATPEQRRDLQWRASHCSGAHRDVIRARIILALLADPSPSVAGRAAGVDVKTVRRWRDRFLEEGLPGLGVLPPVTVGPPGGGEVIHPELPPSDRQPTDARPFGKVGHPFLARVRARAGGPASPAFTVRLRTTLSRRTSQESAPDTLPPNVVLYRHRSLGQEGVELPRGNPRPVY